MLSRFCTPTIQEEALRAAHARPPPGGGLGITLVFPRMHIRHTTAWLTHLRLRRVVKDTGHTQTNKTLERPENTMNPVNQNL